MTLHRALLLSLSLSLFGCGAASYAPMDDGGAPSSAVAMEDSRGLNGTGGQPAPQDAAADRKLIKTGELRVSVDEYEPLHTALSERLGELGGFIADSDLNHSAGRVSWATLVVRVPADQFDALLSWTESRVEVQSLNVDTQDVTERWTDVEARITNNKRTEQRLLGLLETDTAKLEDVLAVERELSRVRGEIESAEGQMRVLNDQVGLATLTLSVSVRADYEPAVAVAYHAKLGSAFTGSLEAMGEVAQGLGIVFVAVVPWLLVLALFGFVAFRFGRMIWRRARA
jgi:hypothetical protein